MRNIVLMGEKIEKIGSASEVSNEEEIKTMKNAVELAFEATLTERQRDCITMYFLEEMTLSQIGLRLGISESTVSRHVKAGRRKLEKMRKTMNGENRGVR